MIKEALKAVEEVILEKKGTYKLRGEVKFKEIFRFFTILYSQSCMEIKLRMILN